MNNTQSAKQLPSTPFPMPIKNLFPFLFCVIAGISSFLFLLAMFSYAPYVSMERRNVLVEQLTPEEEKFYNNASPKDIEVHVQEKLKQINHTHRPGWFYKSRQINGQNHIEAFKRDKFAPNEIMGFC